MVTKENLKDVIAMIDDKDKKRILASSKEYTALCLHSFNVGSYVTVRVTKSAKHTRYHETIMYTKEVQELISGIGNGSVELKPVN